VASELGKSAISMSRTMAEVFQAGQLVFAAIAQAQDEVVFA